MSQDIVSVINKREIRNIVSQQRLLDRMPSLLKNMTTARNSLLRINAIYCTQMSTRDAVRLASTQEQRSTASETSWRYRGLGGRHGPARFANTLNSSALFSTTFCTSSSVSAASPCRQTSSATSFAARWHSF